MSSEAAPNRRKPAPRFWIAAISARALFADETITRTRLGEVVVEHLLGALVGERDEIGRSLKRHLQMLDLAEIAFEAAAGAARGLDHDVDKGGMQHELQLRFCAEKAPGRGIRAGGGVPCAGFGVKRIICRRRA